MVSQIAFPYTFPFYFHTGIREESGAGVDASAQSVEFHEGDDGLGTDLSSLLAIVVKGDTGAGEDEASFILKELLKTDSGLGSDLASLLVSFLKTDSGLGSDLASLLVSFLKTDSGTGEDEAAKSILGYIMLLRILAKEYMIVHLRTEDNMRVWQRGETVPITAYITDADGEAYDPSEGCTITITNPDGEVIIEEAEMSQVTTGEYVYKYASEDDDVIGNWIYHVVANDGMGETEVVVIGDEAFVIQ